MLRNLEQKSGTYVAIEVPAPDDAIYGRGATDAILRLLAQHPDDEFTLRELADHVGYSVTAVKAAVDVLLANDLAMARSEGNRRPVSINADRLISPPNPILRIPQAEFREPVRAAIERLDEELGDVQAVVLYGSVARGEADRRSDIDLWVLVEEDRLRKQRQAADLMQELGETKFDGDRYGFHIVIESLRTVPANTEDIAAIVNAGLPVYTTSEFGEFKSALERLVEELE